MVVFGILCPEFFPVRKTLWEKFYIFFESISVNFFLRLFSLKKNVNFLNKKSSQIFSTFSQEKKIQSRFDLTFLPLTKKKNLEILKNITSQTRITPGKG